MSNTTIRHIRWYWVIDGTGETYKFPYAYHNVHNIHTVCPYAMYTVYARTAGRVGKIRLFCFPKGGPVDVVLRRVRVRALIVHADAKTHAEQRGNPGRSNRYTKIS